MIRGAKALRCAWEQALLGGCEWLVLVGRPPLIGKLSCFLEMGTSGGTRRWPTREGARKAAELERRRRRGERRRGEELKRQSNEDYLSLQRTWKTTQLWTDTAMETTTGRYMDMETEPERRSKNNNTSVGTSILSNALGPEPEMERKSQFTVCNKVPIHRVHWRASTGSPGNSFTGKGYNRLGMNP